VGVRLRILPTQLIMVLILTFALATLVKLVILCILVPTPNNSLPGLPRLLLLPQRRPSQHVSLPLLLLAAGECLASTSHLQLTRLVWHSLTVRGRSCMRTHRRLRQPELHPRLHPPLQPTLEPQPWLQLQPQPQPP